MMPRSIDRPGPTEDGVFPYHLLPMTRQFPVWTEEARRSMDRLIKRLIKVGDEGVVGPTPRSSEYRSFS